MADGPLYSNPDLAVCVIGALLDRLGGAVTLDLEELSAPGNILTRWDDNRRKFSLIHEPDPMTPKADPT